MDGSAFDTLTKTLMTAGSRRRALGGVVLGVLGFLSSGSDETEAKKKSCPPCKKRKKGKCKANVPEGTGCTDTSGRGGTCQGGSCVATVVPPPPESCPSGQKPCQGRCIGLLICCDDTDCPGGKTCQNGSCGCPAGTKLCPDQVCRPCCVNEDCWPNRANQGDGKVCQNGTCICTVAGTRQCPNLNGRCGSCCEPSECSGGKVCTNQGLPRPFACECDRFNTNANVDCGGKCIPASCGSQACGANCTNNPNVCCAPLTCTVDSPTTKACL